MTLRKKRTLKRDERGLATIEIVPLIFIFVLLISYTLGAFGVIHTGIKQSISARSYAFETFRNRSNLEYFRDVPASDFLHYRNFGNRIHGITSEQENQAQGFKAAERSIRMGLPIDSDGTRNRPEVHNQQVQSRIIAGQRNQTVGVSPAWIMVQYGICLNNKCGD